MRFLQSVLSTFFMTSLVMTSPVIDVTVTDAVARSNIPQPSYGAVTHYYAANGSHLATIRSTDDVSDEDLKSLTILANDEIVLKAFDTAAKITEVVCTAAGPIACVTTGVLAVIGTFFLAYKALGRRDPDHIFTLDYPPTADYSIRYLLENEAPEGDWRLIGNATVNGVFHAIHYKRNGTLNGLRSIQYGFVGDFIKRAEDNDGGVVVDYNWESRSETAYDSFHSTQSIINSFSDDIVADLQDANSIQTCADFEDSDGELDSGLVSIGWNNQPFQFQDGQEEALLNECINP